MIARPLNNLLKKNSLFVWTADHIEAFEVLKQALTSAPVLAMPDFTQQFCIETDTSNLGVGYVLLQKGHPLAFISKPFGPKTQGLSTYEKGYMGIVIRVDQWRSYLQQAEFLIFTDQKSLVHLNEQMLNTPWHQKIFTKLIGLQYKIVYKKGTDNGAASALSRRAYPSSQVMAVFVCTPTWIIEVLQSYQGDDFSSALVAKLYIDPAYVPYFTLRVGLLRYKTKIWVGAQDTLHEKIIVVLHSSPLGGHSGIPVGEEVEVVFCLERNEA